MAEKVGRVGLRRTFDSETGSYVLRVDHADPRVLIAAEICEQAVWGKLVPEIVHTITDAGDQLITINAVNRRVIYRILKYVPQPRAYLAEWPD